MSIPDQAPNALSALGEGRDVTQRTWTADGLGNVGPAVGNVGYLAKGAAPGFSLPSNGRVVSRD